MTAIKCINMLYLKILDEKNERVKESVRKKFTEYLDRAEKLKVRVMPSQLTHKEYLQKTAANAAASDNKKRAVSSDGKNTRDDDDSSEEGEGKKKEDAESKKMKAALSGAILSEKPNVHWNDIAGLDMAKEALKEAVILPVYHSFS
jgi:vacuolar protein-sorting-associated protein 4